MREPDWSPDGTQLVASARFEGKPAGLQTFTADGTAEDFFSSGSSTTSYDDPVWAPTQPVDGPRFAITYTSSGSRLVAIFDAHLGLLAADPSPAWSPSWQPLPG